MLAAAAALTLAAAAATALAAAAAGPAAVAWRRRRRDGAEAGPVGRTPTVAEAAAKVLGVAPAPVASTWRRPRPIPEDDADGASTEDLLREVERRSKAVMYVVTNSANNQFSIPNLTKYLRMKGVDVHEGASPEETVRVNARRLLELLEHGGGRPASGGLHHELMPGVVPAAELEARLPAMKEAYCQQPLDYGGHSRYGDTWRISCYMVVMESWKPKIEPHEPMVKCMTPIMDQCTEAFGHWYCRLRGLPSVNVHVMNAFVTRYQAVEDEDQLKKHIDGANVDGSVVLALPTDDPFEGGALHVWDGKPQQEFVYHMRPGDALFLDNAVWHQAMPITSGTRWALVLFLRLRSPGSRAVATAA